MDYYHQESMNYQHPSAGFYHDADRVVGQQPSAAPKQRQQQPTISYATFLITLLLSFTSGSVVLLAATLLWHRALVSENVAAVHIGITEFPLVQFCVELYRRRRRAGQRCWMTL